MDKNEVSRHFRESALKGSTVLCIPVVYKITTHPLATLLDQDLIHNSDGQELWVYRRRGPVPHNVSRSCSLHMRSIACHGVTLPRVTLKFGGKGSFEFLCSSSLSFLTCEE